MERFNLAILGSGPGGYIAAIRAAQLGFRVAVIERDRLGGLCLNWGCIPSKAILKCAELYETLKHSENYGIKCGGLSFDYEKVIDKSRQAANRLSKGVDYLFKKNKIAPFFGTGTFVSHGTIGIRNEEENSEIEIEAERVIIATGTTPKTLPGLQIDGKSIMTSDEAIISKDFPDSVLIIGGGAVGVEFAYIYNSFGSKVTVVEIENQLLPEVDKEVAKELERSFKKSGMEILTSSKFKELKKSKKGMQVTIETSSKEEKQISTAQILAAVGRRAWTQGLGLEELGVEIAESGFIKVDDNFMTTCDGIYAIGDVNGPPLLAHAASEEGVTTVERMAGVNERKVDYSRIPSCIYCQPEVASVGMTEEEAKEKGIKIKIGKFPYRAAGKAIAAGEEEGFVKIITEAEYGEILGCHIIGRGATELIAEVGLAKTLEATVVEIGETVHAHPTLSEAIMEAALNAQGLSRNI